MRTRSTIKVFISYSHEDKKLLADLTDWLKKSCLEPKFDVELRSGDKLSWHIMELINNSDWFIGLGTRSFMRSDYCRHEVEYAYKKDKNYLPILCEEMAAHEIPNWFTLADREGAEVIYERYHGNFEALAHWRYRVCKLTPVKLWLAVVLAALFLIAVPALISYTIRQYLGRAGRDIHELQNWVERLNQDVEGRKFSTAMTPTGRVYHDHISRETVARDVCRGEQLNERWYFRDGIKVATDQMVLTLASDGRAVASKRREIYPHGRDGVVIEEIFDSYGNLISKRVKLPHDPSWRSYGDIGRSIYPPVFLCSYR